jgi:hypothetical protein
MSSIILFHVFIETIYVYRKRHRNEKYTLLVCFDSYSPQFSIHTQMWAFLYLVQILEFPPLQSPISRWHNCHTCDNAGYSSHWQHTNSLSFVLTVYEVAGWGWSGWPACSSVSLEDLGSFGDWAEELRFGVTTRRKVTLSSGTGKRRDPAWKPWVWTHWVCLSADGTGDEEKAGLASSQPASNPPLRLRHLLLLQCEHWNSSP